MYTRSPYSACKTTFVTCIIIMSALLTATTASSQDQRMIRVARITIDSTQVENYNALLKEGIETAIRVEPGVLMLYAVHDKNNPTLVTVFEIYANAEAYQAHLQTPHFKKYKNSTAHMVKSLELADVDPIALGAKKKL
jgi:quinol monooxygenase YgiN